MTREEPRSFKNSMTGVVTKHFVKMILPSRTGIRLRNTATGNSYCRMEATGHAQTHFRRLRDRYLDGWYLDGSTSAFCVRRWAFYVLFPGISV